MLLVLVAPLGLLPAAHGPGPVEPAAPLGRRQVAPLFLLAALPSCARPARAADDLPRAPEPQRPAVGDAAAAAGEQDGPQPPEPGRQASRAEMEAAMGTVQAAVKATAKAVFPGSSGTLRCQICSA